MCITDAEIADEIKVNEQFMTGNSALLRVKKAQVRLLLLSMTFTS